MFRQLNYNDTYMNTNNSNFNISHGSGRRHIHQPQGVTHSTARMQQALRQAQLAQEQKAAQFQQGQQQAHLTGQLPQTPQSQPQPSVNNTLGIQHPQSKQASSQYFDPGVQFEPITDEILKMLGKPAPPELAQEQVQKNTPPISMPPVSGQPAPAPHKPPQEIPPELFKNPYLAKTNIGTNKIAELIQDETNGAVFYRRLAATLQDSPTKNMLEKLAMENDIRIGFLNNFYIDITGKKLETTTPNIEFSGDIRTGLKAAIAEENGIIEKLLETIETEKNDKFHHMLLQKLNNVNKMLEMLV